MRTKLNTPVLMALMAAALVLSLLPPRLAAEQPDGQSQGAPEQAREPYAYNLNVQDPMGTLEDTDWLTPNTFTLPSPSWIDASEEPGTPAKVSGPDDLRDVQAVRHPFRLTAASEPEAQAAGAPASGTAEKDKQAQQASLAAKATNPIASLIQFQVQNTFVPDSYDSSGYANTFVLQPVIPFSLPSETFPTLVTRTTLPIVTTPDFDGPLDGTTGLGDLIILAPLVSKPHKWGMWGVGPALVFPTATDDRTGEGKWQAGPAGVILVTGIKHWQFGVLAYNLWSYAGTNSRADVNKMYFQPVINYHFGKGWYTGYGDLLWTFNWKNGQQDFPVSLRLGKVTHIGKQPVNIFFEPFYTPAHDGATPKWGFKLNLTLLFPK